MMCILVTSFPSLLKKNASFFSGVVILFPFIHSFRISYIHQHPLIVAFLHGTNSPGPNLFLFFSLLYLHEPFTLVSICYRHFILFSSLVFFCKRTLFSFFLYIQSHKTYQLNVHSSPSPPLPPLQFSTTVQYKCPWRVADSRNTRTT